MAVESYADQSYRIADISELREHPENPRQGDVGAIITSIEANGWYGALVTQKSSGYVLVGNHRLKALIAQGQQRVPIIERDVDDQTALTILLSDNHSSDLATYDELKLLGLLQEAHRDGYLAATGYDGDDIDEMRRVWEKDTQLAAHDNSGSRFIVVFNEQDRLAVRDALDDMITSLGIEGVHIA